jgi:hypothetical protein
MSVTFPWVYHGASRKRGAFVRLRVKIDPYQSGACPVSTHKISKRLILRTFHLPIINPTRRILKP